MSELSDRPTREAIKQRAQGLCPMVSPSIRNGKSNYQTADEEKSARMTAVTEQHRIFQANLPILLKRLSKIPDPRSPKKIKYKMTVLMIYGILIFVFQMTSKREANRKMTHPMFVENLKMLFPDIEELPHGDTLMRF